jgi:phytoene synthase
MGRNPMSADAASWEHRLIDWAYQGIDAPAAGNCAGAETTDLQGAYESCEAITRHHSRTFHLASALLPYEKRRAVRALYAFCRMTDDIVDNQGSPDRVGALTALNRWRDTALDDCPTEDRGPLAAWADARQRYGIPQIYAEQLIDGVARDLTQDRYCDFADLASYCYGVASTVGLMAMHIIGFSGPEAIPYAVKLGVALQLTNILRDVSEDWELGRLYLPLEDLATFGLREETIAKRQLSDGWRAFMAFQINRVRNLYRDSLPGIQMLHRDGRFAIGAAAELYRGILDDIEAHDMDVFNRRAYVSTARKLTRLPGIWWRSNVVTYQRPAADD